MLLEKMSAQTTKVAEGLFAATTGLSGIKKALGSFGPIGSLLGVGLGVAGGLGDLALRSAGSVSGIARGAFGADTSYGQFQNAQASLSPFLPNPEGSLQGVAAAQWNPAAAGMLGLYGVQGKPSPQAMTSILEQSVAALRRSHNLMLPQVSFAEQLLGLSPTDMISLANQSPKDLNAAYQNMLNPKLNAAQNVAGPVISSDQRTAASWDVSMNTASAKFAAALAPLNPIVVSFGQSVAGFAGAVSKLVGGATAPGAMSGPGGIMSRLPIAFGGQGNGPGGIQAQSSSSPSSRTYAGAVMSQFEAAGYSKNFAAAMAAQANAESSFNAGAVNITKGQKHAGLFQWSATRRAQILQGTGIDVWTDLKPQDQVKASIWELQNTQKYAASKIAASPNAVTAGTAADKYYEGSGDSNAARLMRGATSGLYSLMGPSPRSSGLPSSVEALVKRISKQPVIHVKATVSNPTSSRVAMSARAAAG